MRNVSATKTRAKFYCFLLLGVALMACSQGGGPNNVASSRGGDEDSAYAELCKKYEACGCEQFAQCMKEAANSPELQKPEVRECMLKSSCQSLCAGHPDGCVADSGGGPGGGTTSGSKEPNCAAIPCSKNSDCPVGCYGGCGGGVCLSF
jgi:hypothetical protein